MTNKDITIPLPVILSALGLLALVFGGWLHLIQRVTTAETEIRHLKTYNENMNPVIIRLDKSVLKLTFVLDGLTVKDGTIRKGVSHGINKI